MHGTIKENYMKMHLIIAAVAFITTTIQPLQAGPSDEVRLRDIQRTHLMKEDLTAAGREVIQVRVDIPPGVVARRHNHPGEELVYVIEGALEYRLDGRRQ